MLLKLCSVVALLLSVGMLQRLTCDMVEILSCIKDRELADSHMQHCVDKETKEFEDELENMNLDEVVAPRPGTSRIR